jgi:hypothetical protein
MARKTRRQPSQQSTEPAADLLTRLHRLYGGTDISADPFGRRQAMPSEVQRALNSADHRSRDKETKR